MNQQIDMNEVPAPAILSNDVYGQDEETEVLPPHDIDTEWQLLGAILMNNDVYYKIADDLKPEHFYEGLHADIYFKIAELLGQNTSVSPITMKVYFEDHPIIKDINDPQYLTRISANTTASARTIKDFANTIIDLAKRRELIRIAQELEDNARDMNCTPDFADIAEVEINSLSQTGSEQEVFSIFEAGMELMRRAEEAIKEGKKVGIPHCLPSLNAICGYMMPGDLIILSGSTSAGKTALSQQIAINVAETKPVKVISLEMTAPEFVNRYAAQRSGISTEKIETGDLTTAEFDRVFNEIQVFKEINMDIDASGILKVSQIRARAKKMQREGGLAFLLIDHIGFIQFEDRRTNKIDGIAEVTRDLKALAKELRIPIIAISHMNRDANKRDNHRPMLSDLFGSSSIEKDADIVLFVHREQYWLERNEPTDDGSTEYADWEAKLSECKGKAELILAKRRRGKGAGLRLVEFDEAKTMFNELPIHNPPKQTYYSSEAMI
ncbi:MAG: AAA family ATPase [Hyphomicrobiales bacterium]